MTSETYTTRKGVTQFRPVLSPDELTDLDSTGFCLACGQSADHVEPDAERRKCEGCLELKVYGLEQLLVMGLAKIEGDK